MLLIFPPVGKPCEPPAGAALLSRALKDHNLPCQVIDANLEGLLYLIHSVEKPVDSWSRRALKNRDEILADLRGPTLYTVMDRYRQKVFDLNKLLSISVDQTRFKITLSDYSDNRLSSVNSDHLLKSASLYRENSFYDYFEQSLRPQIDAHDDSFIGISTCYLNQVLVSFALAGWIKDNFKDKKIVMGGGLISSWMSRQNFNNPFSGLIDHMIKGEGEIPLLKLYGVKEPEKTHFIPDYDFVKDNSYLAPGKILPFRGAIGCYWSKCRFCPEKAETRPYTTQRPDAVLDDLKWIEKKYQPDVIHFIDNAVTPAFLRAVSRNRFSFKWYGFVRFEKDLLDPDYCRKLKRSGCAMLKLGLESGDQGVLDQMNKGTNLDDVSVILENLSKAGILTFVYLLFGTSFEDEAAAFRTLDFIRERKAYIDYLNLAVFNLPRFSDDAAALETSEFYHGDLSLYLNFTHPHGWERKKVKRFLDKTFKKQVMANGGIRQNPPYFSSNHAMFFPKKGE